MYQVFKNWLNKPYYLNRNSRFNLKMSISFGTIVFLFLVLFQPVGATDTDITMNPYVFRFTYGFITTSVMLFYFFVFMNLFPNYYNKQTWTIGKHLINILGIILTFAVINVIFTKNTLKPEFFEQRTGVFDILIRSVTYGLFPTMAYIYYDEKQRLAKAKIVTEMVMKKATLKKSNRINHNKKVTIYSTNKKDTVSFKVNDLVYITSESNYACFFIKERESIKERILRLPLKSVEMRLEEFKNIIRCHKSYIVNSNYVKNISGNARGYYLHFEELENKIPVSRRLNQQELENLISL